MTETKTYSPGAWKAAESILSRQVRDLRLQGIFFSSEQFNRVAGEMAEIIHRETKQDELQELLKVAEAAAQAMETEIERDVAGGKTYLKCALDIHRERLQAAIKKFEE